MKSILGASRQFTTLPGFSALKSAATVIKLVAVIFFVTGKRLQLIAKSDLPHSIRTKLILSTDHISYFLAPTPCMFVIPSSNRYLGNVADTQILSHAFHRFWPLHCRSFDISSWPDIRVVERNLALDMTAARVSCGR